MANFKFPIELEVVTNSDETRESFCTGFWINPIDSNPVSGDHFKSGKIVTCVCDHSFCQTGQEEIFCLLKIIQLGFMTSEQYNSLFLDPPAEVDDNGSGYSVTQLRAAVRKAFEDFMPRSFVLDGKRGFFSMIDNFGWASCTNTWTKTGKTLASFFEHNTPWPTTFVTSFGSSGKLLWDPTQDFLWVHGGYTAVSTANSDMESDDHDCDMGISTQPIRRSDLHPSTYAVRAEPVSDRDDDDAFENDPFLRDVKQPRQEVIFLPSEHGNGMPAEVTTHSTSAHKSTFHGQPLHTSTPAQSAAADRDSGKFNAVLPKQDSARRSLFLHKNPTSRNATVPVDNSTAGEKTKHSYKRLIKRSCDDVWDDSSFVDWKILKKVYDDGRSDFRIRVYPSVDEQGMQIIRLRRNESYTGNFMGMNIHPYYDTFHLLHGVAQAYIDLGMPQGNLNEKLKELMTLSQRFV